MLECIKQVHELKTLHRDIKPANFRVKNGQIYITDFGTSFEYMTTRDNPGGEPKHIVETSGQHFKGTLHFSSIKNHQRYNQGRKDDIEALGYTIVYLLTDGEFSWMTIENNDRYIKMATQQEFIQKKLDFINDPNPHPRLKGIQLYLRDSLEIEFTEQPDYDKFKKYLQNLYIGYDEIVPAIIY